MRAKTRGASSVSLRYLPGLDGIRAIAVVAVIATHTVASIPGGFLSVDVFFVLSGYLITSLLVAEWRRTDTISLGWFWARRARRLLPALFLMLTAVGAGAALWPQIFGSPSLRGDTLATVFYVANWHFIADHTNYFHADAIASPLLHTWSLAIEEQFYVVWPIVVLAVLGRRRLGATDDGPASGPGHQRRRLYVLFAVAAAGAVASAVWMAVLTAGGADTTRAFYGSDTRAQAILVGAALALGSVLWGPARSLRTRSAVLAWGAAGAIGTAWLWATVPASSVWVFRGGFMVAALGTAGVIACVAHLPSSPIVRVLSWRPLGYVGRISYGMYLWYWPMVLVLSPTRTGLQGYPLLLVRLAVIVGVASASAYLVELPIRRGRLPTWWTPVAMPVAASLAVLTTFLATVGVSEAAGASRRVDEAALSTATPGTMAAGAPGAVGGSSTANPSRVRSTSSSTGAAGGDLGHVLIGRGRPRQGPDRRRLGSGHPRRRPGAGDVAVRRGGGERG